MKSKVLRSLLFLALCLHLPSSAMAKYQWGFGNVSLNYLAWDQATLDKSPKRDFAYFEIEGGAQYDWGELYGFFDIEDITAANEKWKASGKGIMRYYLGKSNVSIYAHMYQFSMSGFSEQNRILGLGYQFTSKRGWFKPFLGIHDVTQTYFTGLNGFLGGWIIGYPFRIGRAAFLFTNWHEVEFKRKPAYSSGNGGKSYSLNGAAAVWWNANRRITLGAQWRYAVDKLGTAGQMHAAVASLKFNL
jgi:hypothetical protein